MNIRSLKTDSGTGIAIMTYQKKERLAFNQYESIVIKNPRFKKHTTATYKG
ncbi:hypothetical protein AAGS39_47500 [Flavobacterium sp. CGRL2]